MRAVPIIVALAPLALVALYFAVREAGGAIIGRTDENGTGAGTDTGADDAGAGNGSGAGTLFASATDDDDEGSSSGNAWAQSINLLSDLARTFASSSPYESAAPNVPATWALPRRADPYSAAVTSSEQRYGLPDSLLARLLQEESRYRPEVIDGTVRSSAGATGIAQFMPATARELGIDATDPYASIDAAGKYLRRMFNMTGTWAEALAAYNGGIGNLQRRGSIAAMKPETRGYVARILADVPA